jgi:hypothetical protein
VRAFLALYGCPCSFSEIGNISLLDVEYFLLTPLGMSPPKVSEKVYLANLTIFELSRLLFFIASSWSEVSIPLKSE